MASNLPPGCHESDLPGYTDITCSFCDGTGQISIAVEAPNQECDMCDGWGYVTYTHDNDDTYGDQNGY